MEPLRFDGVIERRVMAGRSRRPRQPRAITEHFQIASADGRSTPITGPALPRAGLFASGPLADLSRCSKLSKFAVGTRVTRFLVIALTLPCATWADRAAQTCKDR